MDDKRWTMAVGKQHDSVLPSRQRLGIVDFIPGTSSRVTPASLCGVFQTHCLTMAVANRRRRRRRYRPQPTVTGRDVARNVSTEIATQTQTQKKGPTSMRLDPESGGYLLSRNSVPSAIASLTSLFGMGRGGTSLP